MLGVELLVRRSHGREMEVDPRENASSTCIYGGNISTGLSRTPTRDEDILGKFSAASSRGDRSNGRSDTTN